MKQLVFLFLASVPTALGQYYRCDDNTKKGWNDSAITWVQNYDTTNNRINYTVATNMEPAGSGCFGNVADGEVTDFLPIEGMTLNIENNPNDNSDLSITNLSMTWTGVNFHTFLIRHECNQKPYMKVTADGDTGAGCYLDLKDSLGNTATSHECTATGAAGSGFTVSGNNCGSLTFTVTVGSLAECQSYTGNDAPGRYRDLSFIANNWCGPEYGNFTVDAGNSSILVTLGGVAATVINAFTNTSTTTWTNASIADAIDYQISVADVAFRLLDGSNPAEDVVNGTTYTFEYVYTSELTAGAGGTATTASDVAACVNGTQTASVHDCANTTSPWGSTAAAPSRTVAANVTTMTFDVTPNCNTIYAAFNDCCLSALFTLEVMDSASCQGTARRQLSSPLMSGRSLQIADYTQTSRAFTMRVLRPSDVDDAGVDVTVAVDDEDTGVAGWVPPVAVAALLICAALVYTLTRSPKMLQRALGPATKVLPTE